MVPLEVLGVSQQPEQHGTAVVLLRHENRILPILVGLPEASAIQMQIMGEKPPRPLTHDLICNLLTGLRADLRSVSIYKLENDIFFAQLNIEQKSASGQVEQVLRVDTRPSDGIAVAVRKECPIYAAEEVMDTAAQDASILGSAEDFENGDADNGGFEA